MTTMNPVGQLVAVIQSQLAARTAPQGRNSAVRQPTRSARRGQQELTGLIELRVAQISPDDAQRGRKAFRVFLEAVLLAHFGAALANDPRFYQLLDDVQGAMEADPACARLVDAAVGHLLGQAPG